jgi:hypothetical protein
MADRREKYGLSFPLTWNALDIELHCFKVGRSVEQGGLGKTEHWWRATDFLWGANNPVMNTTKYFIRNPWSEDMIEEACQQTYLAVGGASGGTKSETFALWLIVNYLANARHYLGIMLSTSLKEARKRIWGSAADFIRAVPKGILPLRVLDSLGVIRYESATYQASDRACLALVAAERKQEKEAVGKLIGMHQDTVCVVADELTELGESILEYALPGGNLSANPKHQFIGLSNPASYYDPFAQLWKPKAGWTSITVEDSRWETQYGVGLHFDAMKSPNIPEIKFVTPAGIPFLPTSTKIDAAMEAEGGVNSVRFWRMIRGFMCPMGQEALIYSEADIIKYKGDEPAIWGDTQLIRLAGCDPGFTNYGDRTSLYFSTLGRDKTGQLVLQFDDYVLLYEDVTKKEEDRSYQIATQIKEQCEKRKVLPFHCGIDSTGAGSPFCDVVGQVWSRDILRVNFGGKASELPVSLTDPTIARERYYDRVTEIWYSGKELLRQGQLKGISPAMAAEMCIRMYGTTGAKKLIYAESKADMKLRTHKSPDIVDSAFVNLTVARERCGLTMIPSPLIKPAKNLTWRQVVQMKRPKRTTPMNFNARRNIWQNPEA